MEKLFAYSQYQHIALIVWGVLAVLLINYGGRNNTNYTKVVQTGFRLILIGVVAAAILGMTGTEQGAAFTGAATNFVLILSAAVGANYVSHAKMSLRKPNDETPPVGTSTKEANSHPATKRRATKGRHV